MVDFEDYLNKCLENPEFRKYWEEDMKDTEHIEELSVEQALESLNYVYDENALYESEEEYKKQLDDLIRNKGIEISDRYKMRIKFYSKAHDCPVVDFLQSIENEKLKEKTVKNIYDLSILGAEAKLTKLSSYVDDGILELRTKQGSNIDRIFYFFIDGNTIIMTNGYIKKTQKMDENEFEKAKRYRDAFYGKKK